MELSPEDNLRINVLFSQELQAVRIDESAMVLHGLTSRGEAQIQLKPNCRDDLYVKHIRELLSNHVLGSPGGYPVYLKRWTRMGQTRDESLDSLLILGEPEAIIAVAHAPGLTEQVARKAWWVMPTAEVARKMLENKAVAASDVGKELAAFLVEHLPFESEPQDIVESVRLVLQPGLVDETTRDSLWKKAVRKSAYYVGFLFANPDAIPEAQPAHPQWQQLCERLEPLIKEENSFALQLVRVFSSQGQSFLATMEKAIDKAANQEVVVAFLQAVDAYFLPSWGGSAEAQRLRTTDEIDVEVKRLMQDGTEQSLQRLLELTPSFKSHTESLLRLALVGEALANPVFSQTDAVGSVMRKKLLPITTWMLENIQQLQQ
ncbi:hypothetical protein [Kaarinaea lacus]